LKEYALLDISFFSYSRSKEAKHLEQEANKLNKNAKKWVELLGTLQNSLKVLDDRRIARAHS
jgi:hypothetical protein